MTRFRNLGGQSGGGANRGGIGGNILTQTDLIELLDNKANINDVYTKEEVDNLLDNIVVNKTSIQTRLNESGDDVILSEVPIEDITVMKNRVIQYKDIDYEITGGVTLTFFTPFSNADIMVLPYMY